MPAGPASLALATGAALIPAYLWYSDEGGPGGQLVRLDARGDKAARRRRQAGQDSGDDTSPGGSVRRRHRRAPAGLAHAPAVLAGRRAGPRVKVGLVPARTPGTFPAACRRTCTTWRRRSSVSVTTCRSSRPPTTTPRCRRTSSRRAARSRCLTTVPSPAWRSVRCRRGACAGGCARATSTSCTFTSPPRRACPCSRPGRSTARSSRRSTRPCNAPAPSPPRTRSCRPRWRRSAPASRSRRQRAARWSNISVVTRS